MNLPVDKQELPYFEYQSGHRRLALLVVWEPQHYEFVSIYEYLFQNFNTAQAQVLTEVFQYRR
jgi:hypothetical protein